MHTVYTLAWHRGAGVFLPPWDGCPDAEPGRETGAHESGRDGSRAGLTWGVFPPPPEWGRVRGEGDAGPQGPATGVFTGPAMRNTSPISNNNLT
jgi:hypothetical protein